MRKAGERNALASTALASGLPAVSYNLGELPPAILARSTHGLAGVVTGLLERAGEVELLGQLGVEDGARTEARLPHQQLRSSKDSNTKGVVDAYDAAPMATTAARHAASGGKLVGRLKWLMAMHIAASSCRS